MKDTANHYSIIYIYHTIFRNTYTYRKHLKHVYFTNVTFVVLVENRFLNWIKVLCRELSWPKARERERERESKRGKERERDRERERLSIMLHSLTPDLFAWLPLCQVYTAKLNILSAAWCIRKPLRTRSASARTMSFVLKFIQKRVTFKKLTPYSRALARRFFLNCKSKEKESLAQNMILIR